MSAEDIRRILHNAELVTDDWQATRMPTGAMFSTAPPTQGSVPQTSWKQGQGAKFEERPAVSEGNDDYMHETAAFLATRKAKPDQ
mgnify:FL=1